MSARVRRRLRVRGVVQGVGFRPFVYTTAAELALTGTVANDPDGVLIEVEGAPAAVDEFARRVTEQPPPLAVVASVEAQPIEVRGGTGFRIADTAGGSGRTLVSPDVAICADCARELRDPADRRYRHPFVNCTNCGPRFTIIAGLPYDRERTSMADFAMCARCAAEYADPADRRFHAQPVACPECGPTVRFFEAAESTANTADPIAAARVFLSGGGILAVKGIGGYHLACDADNDEAVRTLRARKRRGDKPFAVMVADLDTAAELVRVDATAAALLSGAQRPIVLLPRGSRSVAPSVAPGNPDLGVMIAYTPLHLLLFGLPGDPPGPRVLVMTSGNLGGEPLCYEDADARTRLAGLADAFLTHDRRILVPCDDSVVRVLDGAELPVRRSRGYAPLPLALSFPVPPTLAVGADLKNTCAVAEGRYAWLSQHVGDMDDLATLRAFDAAHTHLEELTGVRPRRLVADAHPGYRSTAWARDHAGDRPVQTVQHHHAHIAAVMGEHGLAVHDTVLGFAFDGTGYGPDGAVWGGEMLVAGYKGYRRIAHLRYVPLAGGDVSVRRPYRMALSHLRAAGIDWTPEIPSVAVCPESESAVLAHQFETGLGCAPTSSMGRLFDAVASLAGVRHVVDFEAQAAIELEGLARRETCSGGYRFAWHNGDPAAVDAAPVIAAVVADVTAGVAPGVIAARFHHAVADLVAETVRRHAAPHLPVALSGGVFQNALLLTMTRERLRGDGIRVLTHRRLPPNDGGLAFGQLLVAGAG
ncbi:carbamoyltransferase HypF [Nocardia puris]|uniref:Carbamoyltransferase n=1 Tax=Nocardia puris TaxID=208602 RepID=A0A366DHC7_9NOCA|nr:carbamoyltransferase HypF [Nocardia puris]MBF6213288.1 carbamoyltransferase HypF [Nocardia puris]MBF6369880.1 carbamoyltransferase HypF [Nocardia puris]MBF6462167.1 carbamoyltransferase HypF [Nocardia puris]RBO89473.1 hydrogenase maturation protein HypF [Nocardia puris]